jgi:hypothetical protein
VGPKGCRVVTIQSIRNLFSEQYAFPHRLASPHGFVKVERMHVTAVAHNDHRELIFSCRPLMAFELIAYSNLGHAPLPRSLARVAGEAITQPIILPKAVTLRIIHLHLQNAYS